MCVCVLMDLQKVISHATTEMKCTEVLSVNSYGTLFFTKLLNNCKQLSIPLANNK